LRQVGLGHRFAEEILTTLLTRASSQSVSMPYE